MSEPVMVIDSVHVVARPKVEAGSCKGCAFHAEVRKGWTAATCLLNRIESSARKAGLPTCADHPVIYRMQDEDIGWDERAAVVTSEVDPGSMFAHKESGLLVRAIGNVVIADEAAEQFGVLFEEEIGRRRCVMPVRLFARRFEVVRT